MNGEIEEPNEYRIIRKDGTIFPADVYSSVILRNERPQGLRGIVIDITERKEAEKRQRQITRDLQAVVEIADELIKCRTMDEIYRRAVELIRGKLDVERCSIFIRDDDCVTGTFGTDLQGNTVDERDYRNKLTGRWKRFFDTPVGKGRRWIAEEMDQHLLEGEDFSTIGFGWVVRTPIALEHERPDALLFNDTATSRRPMDAAKQDVLAVLCSLLADITANKRMQDELRLSEQRYRTIFQTTGTASAIVDRHKRFVLVNQRFEELSGYTSRDLLTDKTWDEFLAPEDRERQMRAYAERKDVPAEEPREYDFRFLRKNGEHRFVHLNVSQIPGTDRIVASLEDRTELKTTLDALQTSEKRFREMAELLPETIFEIDTENRFTYVNRRALELFGYTQQDIDEGVDVFSLFPEDERARVRENLKRRLAEEEVGGQEYVVTRKDGSTLPVMIYANRIVKGGKGVGLRGIVIDISERKKAEEERKALAARLLEVQEEERTKISSSLHDQLGQLLFLAKLDIDSVQPYDEASKQARNNSLRRLDEALYSMRHLARSLRPPLLDNLGMCTAMETLAEEVIEGTQLQIDFKCENNVPTLKSSVETSLYRVLQEALTNVVKHSQATRVSVRVDVEEQYVTLRVKDNGKGIHSGDTFAGSGLGLIGMRERMHRCSGELDIDAAADRGTELIARVPIAPNIREEETE
jgi:PAS domain S-box-containing protein